MALVSPGVQVSIIDESNFIPSATNSVPYILLATAQNKISASGTGVAAGTLAANANKVYLVTSQRDLVATYGNPFFYKTTAGTPINGYELNEYGLLAAYSALGVTNRAYIQRVNINLADLTASLTRPLGEPSNGTYWLDIANTAWGCFQWNNTTGAFTLKVPTVITNTNNLNTGVPSSTYGSIGDYAIVGTNTANPMYYKSGTVTSTETSASRLYDLYNTWVLVGSDDWKLSWVSWGSTNSVTTTLTAGNSLVINGTTVNVPVSPNNTLAGLSAAINTAAIQGVYSAVINNRLAIYIDSSATADGSTASGGAVVFGAASTAGLVSTLGVTLEQTYYAPAFQQSPNYTVPRWRVSDDQPRPLGSVWNKITAANLGTNMVVKKYSTILGAWIQQTAPVYSSDAAANAALDQVGGGRTIPAGATYTQYNVSPELNMDTDEFNNTYTLQLFERQYFGSGNQTVITGSNTIQTFVSGNTFSIQTSTAGSSTLTSPVTATVNGTTASAFLAAVSATGVQNIAASVDSSGAIVITQTQGGVIVLKDLTGTPVAAAGFSNTVDGCRTAQDGVGLILSSWIPLTYTASETAPTVDPADGRYWYYSATNQVDIMINDGTAWRGYKNVSNDVRGYNLTQTDPNGPQISPTAPTTQSDSTPLVYGDLWIDTSNLELYPVIKRWQIDSNGVDQWVTINNTDQTTENGAVFSDARWDTTGTTNPVSGTLPSIKSLLTSNYLDIDAPDYSLYPTGMLLWNTRRSGFNVKSYYSNYFNATDFSFSNWSSTVGYNIGGKVLYNAALYVCTTPNPPVGTLPTNTSYWSNLVTGAWVTASGNKTDGSPYMGRFAQRSLIVAALKSGIDSSTAIREEQNQFNLLACPQYPELLSNLIALNNERNNTAFVIGDTPLRLPANANDIVSWATDNNGNGYVTGDGLNTGSTYSGVFWPSCQTNDLSGSTVVQPPSHMMIRTMIRNDEIAYPWLAPAGTRRGVIDNASAIGYINAATGEFVQTGVNQGLRDVLYINQVNPITFVPGVGITNFGNKTVTTNTTALNRINVARLIAFLRGRLNEIGKQFLFEPNDQITRNEIKNAINGLMIDLVAKRGIYDFLVVCDLQNNTPARIDANELWVDIAIEPVKAVEFIYIPVRIKNTGEIAASSTAVVNAG